MIVITYPTTFTGLVGTCVNDYDGGSELTGNNIKCTINNGLKRIEMRGFDSFPVPATVNNNCPFFGGGL